MLKIFFILFLPLLLFSKIQILTYFPLETHIVKKIGQKEIVPREITNRYLSEFRKIPSSEISRLSNSKIYFHFGLDIEKEYESILIEKNPNLKIIDMSKGMQRQAALILAISTCPRYLLLDEIFDGLDPVVRRLVKKILIDNVSANDMTVVIASHNLRELEELCDRICLIHKGKLLLEREIDEIKLGLRKVQVAFTEVPDNSFFEEINVINLWRNGNIFNLTIRGTEDEFMPKLEERKPLYISAVPMTLEEIFISEMGAAGYDAENII